jgi:ABC-type oligopeptide transport system ATPase subunit
MSEEREKILEIKDVCMDFKQKRHKVVHAVNHVSLDIYKGENFGLVGESGCGKTTLGRTCIRLYDPTSGQIIFDGHDISGKLTKDTRKFLTSHMAMIFQDPIASLDPRMTVQEIIAEGLHNQGYKDKAQIDSMVKEMLNKVGLLPEHATRYPHEFSGGQRQRIGIARALVLKPEFIIADEPVSALDASIQAQVINLLMDMKEEFGLTIMFIAHNLAVVKYFSDRIGVMYYGTLVELADADDLYVHPLHPYTKALLSAIPEPDPLSERRKTKLYYDKSMHDYSKEKPSLQEVVPGHFVYCSDSEKEAYLKELDS